MDPFTLMAGAGFLMQAGGLFGAFGASKQAQKEAEYQAQQEIEIQKQKRTAMELSSRRQQMENLRNTQLQRSMAITAATAQGAQLGTGLQGGLAQVTNTGNWNALGINQNTEIGENIFDLNQNISYSKINQSQHQADAAMWQGFGQLGGSLMGASGKMGNIFGGMGGQSQQNFGPSYNTYGGFVNSIGSNGIY